MFCNLIVLSLFTHLEQSNQHFENGGEGGVVEGDFVGPPYFIKNALQFST